MEPTPFFAAFSTLYHDIGKLFNPHYFTENRFGGLNIHQLLTPQESTQVIISHVLEGEALARKHHLPDDIIDIIRQHHQVKKSIVRTLLVSHHLRIKYPERT